MRERLRAALPGLFRLAAVGAVLLAAALAVRWKLGAQLTPRAALGLLQEVQGERWALPAFALAYLLLTTALAPAVVFHMASGAAWGFWPGLAINLAVFNGTASAHFFLARRAGRARVSAFLQLLGLGRLDERLSQVGLASAIALRVLPLPTLVASASAGVSGMRWRDFALGSLFGALPWIAIYTWFAAAIVAGVEGAERESFLQALAAAVLILAGTAATRLLRRRRARRP